MMGRMHAYEVQPLVLAGALMVLASLVGWGLLLAAAALCVPVGIAAERRHHLAHALDAALGVGEGAVLLEEGRARQENMRVVGGLVEEEVVHDDAFHGGEAGGDIARFLELAEGGDGVRIFIGSENKLFSLSGSSLVVSPYMNADRRIVGAVGVIGPTRLNYGRIVPIVDYTAQLVGKVLSDRKG